MRAFCLAPVWWPGQERGSPGKFLPEAAHPTLLLDWCISSRWEMTIHQDLAAPLPEWVTRFLFSRICIKWVRGVGRKRERPGGWYKKQDPRQQPATPAESPHPSHPPGGTNQTFSSRQKNKHDMNQQSKPQQALSCRCSFPQGPMVPNSSQPALEER